MQQTRHSSSLVTCLARRVQLKKLAKRAGLLSVSIAFAGGVLAPAHAIQGTLQLLPKELKGRIVGELDPASVLSLMRAAPDLRSQMRESRMWLESVKRSHGVEVLRSYQDFKVRLHRGFYSGIFRLEMTDVADLGDFLQDSDAQRVARGLLFAEESPVASLSAVEWAEAISKFRGLEILRFAHLSELGTQVALRGLDGLQSLREFTCEGCFFNPRGVGRLGEVLRQFRSLESLDLTGCSFRGRVEIETAFREVSTATPGLRVIRLDSVQVLRGELRAILAGISTLRNLEELSLPSLKLISGEVEILSSGLGFPKLRILDLSHNHLGRGGPRVGVEGLGRVLSSAPRLEVLALRDNGLLASQVVDLSEGLSGKTRLRGVDLAHNPIKDLGVEVVLRSLGAAEHLEFLDLSSVGLHNRGMKVFAGLPLVWPHLRVLKLKNNYMETKGLQRLLNSLEFGTGDLEWIDLRGNDLVWFGADRTLIGELRQKVANVEW